jgi:hypothetical protein
MKTGTPQTMSEIVCRWLYDYQFFQGIDGPQTRSSHEEAALLWTDLPDERSDRTPLNVPVKSYAELMAAYSTAGEGFHVACIEKCYGCVIPMAFQCSIALPRRVRY